MAFLEALFVFGIMPFVLVTMAGVAFVFLREAAGTVVDAVQYRTLRRHPQVQFGAASVIELDSRRRAAPAVTTHDAATRKAA